MTLPDVPFEERLERTHGVVEGERITHDLPHDFEAVLNLGDEVEPDAKREPPCRRFMENKHSNQGWSNDSTSVCVSECSYVRRYVRRRGRIFNVTVGGR